MLLAAALAATVSTVALDAARADDTRHNVILFVPDGLRAASVTAEHAPAMAALRDRGVDFRNSHSMFPTFTMPNSSSMATGHYLGDTGAFSNTIYPGYPVALLGGTITPFIENDGVLGDIDEHFAGNYLNEDALLDLARKAGLNTAAIGKIGPTLQFAHTERTGTTVVVDDATGSKAGIPLAGWVAEAAAAAGLASAAPGRGDNGKAGNATTAGTTVANVAQQSYFADMLTRVVLPKFKQDGKPFVAVFWSRDPDGTQHNQGDSLLSLTPGINGPTSLAAIRNADDDLARIERALAELGLGATTDIVIAADHGFSTISKESATSPAAKADYADVPKGLLPPGFVAIDLATALGLPLWDPDRSRVAVAPGTHTKAGNGLLGENAERPDVVVAANGGSDLVYLPQGDKQLAGRVVQALLAQDYVSGLFVDDALGKFPGTLPLSAINLKGSALTPVPAIVINFRSQDTGCGEPLLCAATVADTVLQQGQGMHGSFSRADTNNFMAATGPSFKAGFVDEAPVSNADVGKTIAAILGLTPADKGALVGRVAAETMPEGTMPAVAARILVSEPDGAGLRTRVRLQAVGDTLYFDAAGFDGRTVGLGAPASEEAAR
jgi:arylsulfatase A-like enzyme